MPEKFTFPFSSYECRMIFNASGVVLATLIAIVGNFWIWIF